jgi:hypothetical protein
MYCYVSAINLSARYPRKVITTGEDGMITTPGRSQ